MYYILVENPITSSDFGSPQKIFYKNAEVSYLVIGKADSYSDLEDLKKELPIGEYIQVESYTQEKTFKVYNKIQIDYT